MTTPNRIRQLLEEANPVTDPTAVHSDDAAADALFSAINTRRGVMHTTPTKDRLGRVPSPPRPWYRRPVAVFAAAVAATILVATPLVLLRSADTGLVADKPAVSATAAPIPGTTIPPAAATTLPPAPATTAAPVAAASLRVGIDVTDTFVGIFDMTTAGSGLVAAGVNPGDDLRQDGVIVASDDGVTWTRLAADDPPLTTGTVLIYGITETESGLVAAGMSCDDDAFPCEGGPYPTVWTSADGASWTRAFVDADGIGAVEDVIATEHGVVAAGWINRPIDGSDDPTVVWTSPAVWLSTPDSGWSLVWDGETVETEQFPPGVNRILALAVANDGAVVAVGSGQNNNGEEVAAVWTSNDAEAWARVEAESPDFGSDTGRDVTMIDVASSPSGLVAVGNEGATEIAVWQSPDGRVWTRIDTASQPNATSGVLSAITPLDTGWAAAGFGPGFGDGPVTVWTSPDALVWTRTATLDDGYAQAITTHPGTGRVAIAGGMLEDDDFHAAIWSGQPNELDAMSGG